MSFERDLESRVNHCYNNRIQLKKNKSFPKHHGNDYNSEITLLILI